MTPPLPKFTDAQKIAGFNDLLDAYIRLMNDATRVIAMMLAAQETP